jgi:arginase family enzyme
MLFVYTMSLSEVVYFHHPSENAEFLAHSVQRWLGIAVAPLVLGEDSNLDPERRFIVFGGDGYEHHLTRPTVQDLIRLRCAAGKPPFSYVHIDAHDDMAVMPDGDTASYKSFVAGIAQDNNGGVYFLEEGLTGRQTPRISLLTPGDPDAEHLDWGPATTTTRDREIYLSLDFDVLDADAGINHLFPQPPVGFTLARLAHNLGGLGARNNIIGADLVGFSRHGASLQEVRQSVHNIALVTHHLTQLMQKHDN